MKIVYLSLGANLGNKPEKLLRAISEITFKVGKLTAVSSVYETKPDGYESENNFLNMVVCVDNFPYRIGGDGNINYTLEFSEFKLI